MAEGKDVIWIGYTTKYREGGRKFARVARTMAREKRVASEAAEVVCQAVESKREFIAAFDAIAARGAQIKELHFIGHSGMYGIMFGTTDWPEQFSPHEWRNLSIPFAAKGRAYFHACRTARWFAPFFARSFGVETSGYHLYTTFSRRQDQFQWERSCADEDAPLYVVACAGRKSHGIVGSMTKYAGLARVESMQRFTPGESSDDSTYNSVAQLYDRVFTDIRVREDEWRWLERQLPEIPGLRVLDIGCGNGALLRQLSGMIGSGAGVDKSARLIEICRKRSGDHDNLEFHQVDSPRLPFPDREFDVVISLLSFRYLDWDPVMNEIMRVLTPGGKVLIIDMATAPVSIREYPRFVMDKTKQVVQRCRQRTFYQSLRQLVCSEPWKIMLKYNPIRAEHEYKWYLESRFPGSKVEILNIGWNARVLAFDSGPVNAGSVAPLSYP